MASQSTYESERTIGTIVRDLTEHISTLFRSEIALLKLELKDTAGKLGGGVALFIGAAFLGVFGIGFLFVTIVLGLVRLGVPAWLSTLIVTILLFAGAAVLGLMGRKKFAAVQFVPEESVKQLKADVESIQADISRVRSR
jgi:Putative Actinobacterial Holin-X, holin superfamily III